MFDEYADLPDDDEVANPWTHLPTESPPDWLVDLQCRLNISTFRAFLGSRVVFYPYARSDGTPFEVFGGRNHAAHCFLHVDEHLSQTDLEDQLAPAHPRRIRGYTPVDDTLTRLSSQQFMELVHDINPAAQPDNADLQFSLWTVLARDDGFDDCQRFVGRDQRHEGARFGEDGDNRRVGAIFHLMNLLHSNLAKRLVLVAISRWFLQR